MGGVALPLCTMDRTGLMDKVGLSRNPREEHSEEEHSGQRPRPGGEEWDWRVQKTEKAEHGGCCYLSAISLYSRWPTLLSTEF